MKWGSFASNSLKYWGHFFVKLFSFSERKSANYSFGDPKWSFLHKRWNKRCDYCRACHVKGHALKRTSLQEILTSFQLAGQEGNGKQNAHRNSITCEDVPFAPTPESAPALRHDQHSSCHFITLARPLTWLCLVNRHDQGMIAKFITTTR